VVKIQVEIFWAVTLYSVVVGYQHFRRPCCLHFQGWHGPQKHVHPTRTLHSVTTQMTST